MSRSALAATFRDGIGTAPAAYGLDWHLGLAAARLRQGRVEAAGVRGHGWVVEGVPEAVRGVAQGAVGRELKLTAFRKTTIDQDESSQLLRRGRRTIPASIGGSCMSHDSGPLARVVDDIAFAAHTHRVQRRRHALCQPPGRHGAHPGRRSRHRRPDVF